MGRPYITFIEGQNIILCGICNVNLTDGVTRSRNIETPDGSCIECYNVKNYFETEPTIGNLKYFDQLNGIFDPDTIFKTFNTGICSGIHCVNCQQHWGWKYIKPMTENVSFFVLVDVVKCPNYFP